VNAGVDTADVYLIDGVSDARAAKAALQMGAGRPVEARGWQATQAEIVGQRSVEWRLKIRTLNKSRSETS
jgi:hypothetical protein